MTTANVEQQQNNLTELRKEKGLSISDVAEKLKLTSDVIKKLEKSDFDSLGAYPYVRGYLINYASLLQVDADKYIGLIPKENKNVEIVNTYSKSAKLVKFKRQSKGVGNYAIGTFIVLAVSFSGWYLLKMYSNNNEMKYSDANTTLALSPKTSDENSQELDIVNQQELDKPSETDSFHYSSLIPPKEDVSNKQQDAVSDNQTDNMALNEDIISDDKVDSAVTENTESVLQKKYLIEVSALETSWIKIENTDGEKLFADLFQPGIKVFESDSPIHFRIGNQSKVEVSINGDKIDISKYSKKNISDFQWPNVN